MAMKRACAIGVAVLFLLIGNAVSAHTSAARSVGRTFLARSDVCCRAIQTQPVLEQYATRRPECAGRKRTFSV
jgi:hypothetical protein